MTVRADLSKFNPSDPFQAHVPAGAFNPKVSPSPFSAADGSPGDKWQPRGQNPNAAPSWSEEDYEALKNPKIQKTLKRANRFGKREDWKKALPLYLEVWDSFPDNTDILSVIAYGLMQLGVRDMAIKVIERALTKTEPTPDILGIIGNLANSMQMGDIGEKVYRILQSMEPNNPNHYINLVESLNLQQKYDEGIGILQATVPLFPKNALMWSSLGTAVAYRDGPDAALVFYEEGLRLEPDNYRLLNNYASAMPDKRKALGYFKRAIELAPDHPEPRLGYSICQYLVGDIESAHENYAIRLDGRRSADQNTLFTHGLPEWDGSDPKGKTILICNEQGIGDEILFMQLAGALEDLGANLLIGCEARLVKLFQRTFPNAQVSPSHSRRRQGYTIRQFPVFEVPMRQGTLKIDYAVPMGTLMRYFWHSLEDIKPMPNGYLVGDDEERAKWRDRLDGLGNNLKVGFSWSSGLQMKGRKHFYPSLEEMLPMLQMPGIDWVLLQYSQCDDDLAWLEKEHGVTVQRWDDFNIKQDIEGNIALMQELDLVIGPGTSTQMFATMAGAKVFSLLVCQPWWSFGQAVGIPFAPNVTVFDNDFSPQWDTVVSDVCSQLKALLDDRQAGG